MKELKEGFLFEQLDDDRAKCLICNQYCVLSEGKIGKCRVHRNKGGKLYTDVYGMLISSAVDPIEKKPLFHFKPGTFALSIATPGCNFSCLFCQNYTISQETDIALTRYTPPEDVVNQAVSYSIPSISYTYSEPTIYIEYLHDISRLAAENNIANTWVSNGFMSSETIKKMDGLIDAINIDLKSFSDDSYRNFCDGRLKPVLENIETFIKKGVWVEVTTLIVPTMNDSEEEIDKIAAYIASVDKNIPWHVSRFHPMHKMLRGYASTPLKWFDTAIEKAEKHGLRYVYIGNVAGNKHENTNCPTCKTLLIERMGFSVYENLIEGGKCPSCKTEIAGRF